MYDQISKFVQKKIQDSNYRQIKTVNKNPESIARSILCDKNIDNRSNLEPASPKKKEVVWLL
jgi:hypothetical protein